MTEENRNGPDPPGKEQDSPLGATLVESDASTPPGRLAAIWHAACAVIGAVMGLIPHVLHHIGVIAGAAIVTGVGGNVLFFVVGLAFSVPLLRRLYRRFDTWRAPVIAIAAFAVMFSLSAFVIGPAITGDSRPDEPPAGPSQTPTDSHGDHHGD